MQLWQLGAVTKAVERKLDPTSEFQLTNGEMVALKEGHKHLLTINTSSADKVGSSSFLIYLPIMFQRCADPGHRRF